MQTRVFIQKVYILKYKILTHYFQYFVSCNFLKSRSKNDASTPYYHRITYVLSSTLRRFYYCNFFRTKKSILRFKNKLLKGQKPRTYTFIYQEKNVKTKPLLSCLDEIKIERKMRLPNWSISYSSQTTKEENLTKEKSLHIFTSNCLINRPCIKLKKLKNTHTHTHSYELI